MAEAKKSSIHSSDLLMNITAVFSFRSFRNSGPKKNNSKMDSPRDKTYFKGINIQKTFFNPNWSELPKDILEEVADKLDMCEDYLSFASVCNSWLSIAQNIISRLPYTLPICHFLPKKNTFPILLQPCEENNDMYYMYSTIEPKVHGEVHLPELSNKWIPGSSNGWIVTVGIDDVQINLLNPLTRVQISLPPVSTFPEPYSPYHGDRNKFTFVQRVYVSSDPVVERANCLLVALASSIRTISICRVGDDKWHKLIEPPLYGIHDVIMYKGLLYANNSLGKLLAIDIDAPTKKVTLVATLEPRVGSAEYLVESCGSLLLVVRMTKFLEHIEETIGFEVYKLVETPQERDYFETIDGAIHYQDITSTWEKTQCLNDQILFIGHNRCVSLDPSLYTSRCEKNCIYFADGHDERDMYRVLFGEVPNHHDIGVYHMESGNIELLPGLSKSSSRMPSIWLSLNPRS